MYEKIIHQCGIYSPLNQTDIITSSLVRSARILAFSLSELFVVTHIPLNSCLLLKMVVLSFLLIMNTPGCWNLN